MQSIIKVVIVDDNIFLQKAVTEKLSFFKNINLRYCVNNGKELLDKLEQNSNINLILMDLEMPIMNGIEATEKVKQKYPHIKIIILTVFDNDENIFKTIKAGADGYLLKEVSPEMLHQGIMETMRGGAVMTPSIAMKALKLLRSPIDDTDVTQKEEIKLTPRETEVLEQLSKGLNYIQISNNLIISPSTVRKHIENIYLKLQVHNKIEAVQKARNNNLI